MIQGIMRIQCRVVTSGSCGSRRKMTTGLTGSVNKAQLSKLRKLTGFPFINCKKALEQFQNDIEQAEQWLHEQAQKEGWAKASKLQSRPMSQGLVGVIGDSRTATMVEVNCETDFVARNEKFIRLVSELATACQTHCKKLPDTRAVLTSSALGELLTGNGEKLSDMVALQVGNIGENLSLRRAVHVKAADNTFLASYIHASGPEIGTGNACQLGRFGSVMEVERLPEQAEQTEVDQEEAIPLNKLCRQLAQHIVGLGPKRVGDPLVDKPKNFKASPAEDVSEEKDLNVNNSNLECDSSEVRVEHEEEDLLIFQEFLLDPSVSVGELMEAHNIAVKDFVRFECGEDLGEEKTS